ncbi:helix-turn-helix domain-containing protein [Shinella zoogloeoides]|uniref:helix-turn-helix domain-containing protein n=1 Tax=Shinella zoogloeoides TaxID=352475 RepID=UPI001F56A062|nr:helix-turn-helix transcriptional regulator [Shinella zoogloeoides]
MDQNNLSGRQLAAARTLLGKTQAEIASAAKISVPTLKRMEASEGSVSGMPNNVAAVVQALLDFGILFIPSNGNGPGVRLRDRQE